jgi:hypothetical protein
MFDDLSKQAETTIRTWMDAQRKVWESWLDSTRRLGEVRSVEDWEKEAGSLLDQWEQTARSALSIPAEQTRLLTDSLRDEDRVPREAVRRAEQVHGVIQQWVEAQQPLLDAWFATARQFGPARRTGNWDQVMETWRIAAAKAAESQREWARRLAQGTRSRGSGESASGTEPASASASPGRRSSTRSSANRTSARSSGSRSRSRSSRS